MDSPDEIEIRPADHADANAILQILADAFAPHRHDYTPAAFADTVLNDETVHLRLQQMHVLVATAAGKVIGTVSGVCTAGEGHLRGMAVQPQYQGRSVAEKLLTAIEDYLYSHGCRRITLDTTLPLRAAMKFYEKNGYKRSGNIADFFGMPLIEYVKPCSADTPVRRF